MGLAPDNLYVLIATVAISVINDMTFKVAVNGALLLPNKCVLVCLMCPLVHRYSIVTLWYTEINEAVKEIR